LLCHSMGPLASRCRRLAPGSIFHHSRTDGRRRGRGTFGRETRARQDSGRRHWPPRRREEQSKIRSGDRSWPPSPYNSASAAPNAGRRLHKSPPIPDSAVIKFSSALRVFTML
jgi:hypothetical protein